MRVIIDKSLGILLNSQIFIGCRKSVIRRVNADKHNGNRFDTRAVRNTVV